MLLGHCGSPLAFYPDVPPPGSLPDLSTRLGPRCCPQLKALLTTLQWLPHSPESETWAVPSSPWDLAASGSPSGHVPGPTTRMNEVGTFPTSESLHLLFPLPAASFCSCLPCPRPEAGPLSLTPGLCPRLQASVRGHACGPGCPWAPLCLPLMFSLGPGCPSRCGQAEVPHPPTHLLLAPTGVEGFTSQEDQEPLEAAREAAQALARHWLPGV